MLAALNNSTVRSATTLAAATTPADLGAGNASQDATNLRTMRELGRLVDAQDPRVVRQAATQMLSELFFSPMLAEMRKFPFGRELATGGRMEAAFGEQLDQRLADTVAGSSTALVDGVVRQMQPLTAKAAASAFPGQDRAWWPAQTTTTNSTQRGAA